MRASLISPLGRVPIWVWFDRLPGREGKSPRTVLVERGREKNVSSQHACLTAAGWTLSPAAVVVVAASRFLLLLLLIYMILPFNAPQTMAIAR